LSPIEILGNKVWCPLCKQYVELRRVRNAARLTDVHRRTVYRYIDQGLLYAVKVAGKTYRVCIMCLFRHTE
jgi:excisionase family DNA binding protein